MKKRVEALAGTKLVFKVRQEAAWVGVPGRVWVGGGVHTRYLGLGRLRRSGDRAKRPGLTAVFVVLVVVTVLVLVMVLVVVVVAMMAVVVVVVVVVWVWVFVMMAVLV